MKITSEIAAESVKVKIDDILHIHYIRDKYIGLQAWQFDSEGMYYIEITLIDGVITTDYDHKDMWLSILSELDKVR